jgi:hypothetical protein
MEIKNDGWIATAGIVTGMVILKSSNSFWNTNASDKQRLQGSIGGSIAFGSFLYLLTKKVFKMEAKTSLIISGVVASYFIGHRLMANKKHKEDEKVQSEIMSGKRDTYGRLYTNGGGLKPISEPQQMQDSINYSANNPKI